MQCAPQFELSASDRRWLWLADEMDRWIKDSGCHPSRCIVLVPYAQLIAPARRAWVQRAQSGASFVPRIETTQTWSDGLWAARGGPRFRPDDFTGEPGPDLLTAWRWLSAGGLGSRRAQLGPILVEAAQSLWRVAAASEPSARSAWARALAARLTEGLDLPELRLEATLAQMALAWVGASSFITDVLFEQAPDLLMVVEGWQSDPLAQSLLGRLGERGRSLPLADPAAVRAENAQPVLQACASFEEEAQRAAASVLTHLQAGREPVALIAQDRLLTRRIGALLATRQIAVRDETGWTLSTTRAAAGVMALLRAASPAASCDEMLAWLKGLPSAPLIDEAEAQLRRSRLRWWKELRAGQPAAQTLHAQFEPLLSRLRAPRSLAHWLIEVRQSLQELGLWQALIDDAAGQAVLKALWLRDEQGLPVPASGEMLSQEGFVEWTQRCLEAAVFMPPHPGQVQVMVIPIGQLLGRSPAAIVFPGADERHLPARPRWSGPWSERQRKVLGLACSQEALRATRRIWDHLMQYRWVDVLWRTSEDGQALMPALFVQELRLKGGGIEGTDRRPERSLPARPVLLAQAQGQSLPVQQLSASAYEDLRACPYRFFALRQLGLSPAEELDGTVDARDLGRWVHEALCHFHEAWAGLTHPIDRAERVARLDRAAQHAMDRSGIDPIAFLPHRAAWPLLRDAYLDWLDQHERAGHRFEQAESWHEKALGPYKLVGKIDRIDRDSAGQTLLIDYKTERKEKVRARVRLSTEDTQLVFYAALRDEELLRAMYLSLGDRGETSQEPQPKIGVLRALLLEGVRQDLDRLHAGEPLVAIGQGASCTHCQARGLCRRDFVDEAAQS